MAISKKRKQARFLRESEEYRESRTDPATLDSTNRGDNKREDSPPPKAKSDRARKC